MIPPDLLTVLCGISTKIPIYIISSKDLEFLRDKTQFARIISTLMGMEFTRLTPPVNHECLSNHVTNMITEYQLVDAGRIAKNSRTLDQIVQEVSSEFQGLTIGQKFTYMDHKTGWSYTRL